VIILPEEVDVLLDALRDAADYRDQLAGACPARCMERGSACGECEEHQDAADAYRHMEAGLYRSASRPRPGGDGEVVPMYRRKLDRPQNTVTLKGDVL
jgi:hypothetical protein